MTASASPQILIVDDVRANRMLISYICEDLGCRGLEAETGAAALRLTETQIPDVILLDMNLPDMSGLDVCRRIRARGGAYRRIPIINISAGGDGDWPACQSAGMNDRLRSPMDITVLRDLVRKWLPTAPDLGPGSAPAAEVDDADIPVFVIADMDRLSSLSQQGDLIPQLLAEFATSAPQDMRRCRQAAAAGDMGAVTRHAHTLKGSAASIGGRRLAAIARRIEKAGRAGDMTAVDADMTACEQCLDALLAAIARQA